MFKWRGYRSCRPHGYRWSVNDTKYDAYIKGIISSWRVEPSQTQKFAILSFSEQLSRNWCTRIDGTFEFNTFPYNVESYGGPNLSWVPASDNELQGDANETKLKLTSIKHVWGELLGEIDQSMRHAMLLGDDNATYYQLLSATHNLPDLCMCINDLAHDLCEVSDGWVGYAQPATAAINNGSSELLHNFKTFVHQVALDLWKILSDALSLLKDFAEKGDLVGVNCCLDMVVVSQSTLVRLIHAKTLGSDWVSKTQVRVLVDIWSTLSELSKNFPQLFLTSNQVCASNNGALGSNSYFTPMSWAIVTLATLSSVCEIHIQSYMDGDLFEDSFVSEMRFSQQLYHLSLSLTPPSESTPQDLSSLSLCKQLGNFSVGKQSENNQSLLSQILGFSSELGEKNTHPPIKRLRIESNTFEQSSLKQNDGVDLNQLQRNSRCEDESSEDDNWLFSPESDIIMDDGPSHPGVIRQRSVLQEGELQSLTPEELLVQQHPVNLLCLLPILSTGEHSSFLIRCWLPLLISFKLLEGDRFSEDPCEHYIFKKVVGDCLNCMRSLGLKEEVHARVSHMTNLVSLFLSCLPSCRKLRKEIAQMMDSEIYSILKRSHEIPLKIHSNLSVSILNVAQRIKFFRSEKNCNARELFSWWPLGLSPKTKTDKKELSEFQTNQSHLNSFVVEMESVSTGLSPVSSLIDAVFSLCEACGNPVPIDLFSDLLAKFDFKRNTSGESSEDSNETISDAIHIENNSEVVAEREKTESVTKSFGEIFSNPVHTSKQSSLAFELSKVDLAWGAAKSYQDSSEFQTNEAEIRSLVDEELGAREVNPLKLGLSQVSWMDNDFFSESTSQPSISDEILCEFVTKTQEFEIVALDVFSTCLFYIELYRAQIGQDRYAENWNKMWSNILQAHSVQLGEDQRDIAARLFSKYFTSIARVRSPIWLCGVLLPFMIRNSLLHVLIPHVREQGSFPQSFKAILTILRLTRGEFTRSRICARQSYSQHISAHTAVSQLFLRKSTSGSQSKSIVQNHYEAQRRCALLALGKRRTLLRKSLLRSRVAFISLRLCGFAITGCLNLKSIVDPARYTGHAIDPFSQDRLMRWLAYSNRALGIGRSLRHLAGSYLRRLHDYHQDAASNKGSHTGSQSAKITKQYDKMRDLETLARFELRVLNDTIPPAEILFSEHPPGQETLMTLWNWVAQPMIPVVIASARGYSAVQAALGAAESAGIIAMAIRFAARCTCLQVVVGLAQWKNALNAWSPYPIESSAGFSACWTWTNSQNFRGENTPKISEVESEIAFDYLRSAADGISTIPSEDGSIFRSAFPSIALDVLLDYSYAFTASGEFKNDSKFALRELDETVTYLCLDQHLVSSASSRSRHYSDSILSMPHDYLFAEVPSTVGQRKIKRGVLLSTKQESKYSSLIRSMSIVFLMGIISELSQVQVLSDEPSRVCVLDADTASLFLIQLLSCLADCVTPSLALSQLVKFLIHQVSSSADDDGPPKSVALQSIKEFIHFDELPDLSSVGSSIEDRLLLLRILVDATLSNGPEVNSWILAASAPISLDLLLNETSSSFHHSQSPTTAALTALEVIRIFSPLCISAACSEKQLDHFSFKVQSIAESAWAYLASQLLGQMSEQHKHTLGGEPMPPISLSTFLKQLSRQSSIEKLGVGEVKWLETWASMLNDLTNSAFYTCVEKRDSKFKCTATNMLRACGQVLNPLDGILYEDVSVDLGYPQSVVEVLKNWMLMGKATSSADAEKAMPCNDAWAGTNRLLFVSSVLLPQLIKGRRYYQIIRSVSFLSALIESSNKLLFDLPAVLQMISIPLSLLLPDAYKSDAHPGLQLLSTEMQLLIQSMLQNLLRGRAKVPDEIDVCGLDSNDVPIFQPPQQKTFVPLLSEELVHVISLWSVIDLLREGANASSKGISTVIGDYVDSFSSTSSISSKIVPVLEYASTIFSQIASGQKNPDIECIPSFSDSPPLKRGGIDATDWLRSACERLWMNTLSLVCRVGHKFDVESSPNPLELSKRHHEVWNFSTLALELTSLIYSANSKGNMLSKTSNIRAYWKTMEISASLLRSNGVSVTSKKAADSSRAITSLRTLEGVLLLLPLSIESSLIAHRPSLENEHNFSLENDPSNEDIVVQSQSDLPMLVPLSQSSISSEEIKEPGEASVVIDLAICDDIGVSNSSLPSQAKVAPKRTLKQVSFAEADEVIDIIDVIDMSEVSEISNIAPDKLHFKSFKGIEFDQVEFFERGVSGDDLGDSEVIGIVNESIWECIVKAKCDDLKRFSTEASPLLPASSSSSSLPSKDSYFVPAAVWRLPSLLPSDRMESLSKSQVKFEKPSLMTSSLTLLRNLRWFLERALKFAQKMATPQLELLKVQAGFNMLTIKIVDAFLFDTLCTGDRYMSISLWLKWRSKLASIRELLLVDFMLPSEIANESSSTPACTVRRNSVKLETLRDTPVKKEKSQNN